MIITCIFNLFRLLLLKLLFVVVLYALVIPVSKYGHANKARINSTKLNSLSLSYSLSFSLSRTFNSLNYILTVTHNKPATVASNAVSKFMFVILPLPGPSLVRAAEEAAVNAARDAKRAAFEAQELMASARQAAEKARKALELVEASRP